MLHILEFLQSFTNIVLFLCKSLLIGLDAIVLCDLCWLGAILRRLRIRRIYGQLLLWRASDQLQFRLTCGLFRFGTGASGVLHLRYGLGSVHFRNRTLPIFHLTVYIQALFSLAPIHCRWRLFARLILADVGFLLRWIGSELRTRDLLLLTLTTGQPTLDYRLVSLFILGRLQGSRRLALRLLILESDRRYDYD